MHFNVKFLNKYLPNLQSSRDGFRFWGFFFFFFLGFLGAEAVVLAFKQCAGRRAGVLASSPVSQPAIKWATVRRAVCNSFFSVCVCVWVCILVHAPFIFATRSWPTNGTRIYLQLLRQVLLAASRQLYKWMSFWFCSTSLASDSIQRWLLCFPPGPAFF